MRYALPGLRACAMGLVLGFALVCSGAFAEEAPPPAQPLKQIKLTEAQINSFVAAQPDLLAVAGKLQEAGDELDPALKAELEAIAKKHGFSSFKELDDVAANISIVLSGLDSPTSDFTDPVDVLKKELADVQADDSIPEDDKKQLVEELTDAIASTPPLEHKENVDLVKAHWHEIEKALE